MTENIQDVISTKLAVAIANPIFPSLDSQLRVVFLFSFYFIDESAFLMYF